MRLTVIAVASLAACSLSTASVVMASQPPPRYAGEVHADLRSEAGSRVASLSGNVGAKGIGYGDIVPLSGARAVAHKRPERVRLVAMVDGTILVQGQHGTRITVTDRGQGQAASGWGRLRTAARTVPVNVAGEWDQQPFHPRRGQVVLVLGNAGGAVKTAMARRYTLVPYSDARYSRTALIGNPSRYRTVAGVLVGTGVGASRLASLDIARSLYNDGRFVATTARSGMLDRHMYVLAHAHTGQGGVVLRREAPRLGFAVHSYPQLREPVISHSRAGRAKAATEGATFTPEARQRALDASVRHVTAGLGAAERLAPPPKARTGKKKTEMQSTSSDPATVTAGSDDAAYYTVPVDQYITAALTVTSPVTGGLQSQTVGITYNPIYTVSLAQSTSEVTTQAITETNAAQFNALATSAEPMAAGTFSNTTGVVTPAGPNEWGTATGEAGLGLAMAFHSFDVACTGCKGTSGGSITPAFSAGPSSPTQQVTQVGGGSSTGTTTSSSVDSNWSNTTSNTSSWNVSSTVTAGMFGPIPNGSVSVTAGYGQSTTNSSTTGGGTSQSTGSNVDSSINFTTSNWTTTPVQGGGQAQYTTFSTTVAGAEGSQATAAYSLGYATGASSNNGGFIATPSQYGVGNGPGPTCNPNDVGNNGTPDTCAPAQVSPQPDGSGENMTGFTQGSTSYFTLNSSGNQLATGSATPWVVDNFFLFDQGLQQQCFTATIYGGCSSFPAAAYTQLQVLGQSQVSVSQSTLFQANNGPAASTTATAAGGTEGITTYYNAQGQVVNSANQATYQTVGLDLCAPPVLTSALWTSGCDDDPDFSGPPAVYQAAPPTITTSSTTNPLQYNGSTGQAEVASPAPTLTCNPGTWSGTPTYAYQWQQWNPSFGDWQDISGATGTTYTPSSSLTASTYFTCDVTATNSMGSISEPASSVEVIVGG